MPNSIAVRPLALGHVTARRGPFAGMRSPIHAFLISHHDGPILVDTGVGSGHEGIDRLFETELVALTDALANVGLASSDIAAVVNTHLHFDHCGQNRLFPNLPIYVQAAEFKAAQRPAYTVLEWFRFDGANYRQLAGAAEIASGVSLTPTPGHTPGHQSVLVEASGGLAIIAGHAAYTAAEYAGLEPALGGDWDDAAYSRSLAHLRQLEPKWVYFSHDTNVWTRDRP